MAYITLSQDKKALVDDDDLKTLTSHTWHYARRKNKEYAATHVSVAGKQSLVLMHRMIMNAQRGKEIDHRDGNGLNNRKENLRLVTHAQNMKNVKPRVDKYKGVHFRKDRGVYQAYIGTGKDRLNLGHYRSEIVAACAYDYAAKNFYGEFCNLNFPDGQPISIDEVRKSKNQGR